MEEKPRIVITRTRQPATTVESTARKFAFTTDMLPAEGALKSFRRQAWEAFARLEIPRVNEDAWRRTDLHLMPAESFHLPAQEAFRELEEVPQELLRPLTAEHHGGQVILLPGGSRSSLDPELV